MAAALALAITPVSNAGGETPFVLGEGRAYANSVRFAAQAGAAELGLSLGQSQAEYRNNGGAGQGKVIDLGVLKSLLTSSCDGGDPTLDPKSIQPEVKVQSHEPNASTGRSETVFGPGKTGPGPELGTQQAAASTQPWGTGSTALLPANLGIVSATGARSRATVQVIDGNTREARAEVHVDEVGVLLGLLTFKDVEWLAVTRTGAVTSNETHFTFRSVTFLGIEQPAGSAEADLKRAFEGVTQAFGDIGLRFDYPTAKVEGKKLTLSPLAVRIVDSPGGKKNFAPLLAAMQPLRQVLFDLLLKLNCNFETIITVLDVLFGVMAGSGGLHFEVGGVQVSTDDTDYSSPFGGDGGAPPPPTSGSSDTASNAVAATYTPAAVEPVASPPPPTPQAATSLAITPASSRRLLPGTTGGAGAVAGAALLCLVVALAGVDVLSMRRARRRIPEL